MRTKFYLREREIERERVFHFREEQKRSCLVQRISSREGFCLKEKDWRILFYFFFFERERDDLTSRMHRERESRKERTRSDGES